MPNPSNIVYDGAVMLCAANVICQVDDDCWSLCHQPSPKE